VQADNVPVRGVIRAVNEAVISTDITARVSEMAFREGQAFRKGEPLIIFDCAVYEAETAAAWSAHAAAREVYLSNKALATLNAVGNSELRVSNAEMDRKEAEAKAVEARARDCRIAAPFDGRVAEVVIHAHESSSPGEPLIKVLNDTELEIELLIPSRWLLWLEPGLPFEFSVDETGLKYAATVTRLGGAVDPVSQTIRVFGTLEDRPPELLSGMSGTAIFEVPNG
jgi:RND family efflux transporter MFP subunit